MRQLPTAPEAAILIALCVKRKEAEDGKDLNRGRLSERGFGKLTRRRRIDGRFVSDLNEALLDHNLMVVFTGDAIGLLKASAVKGWPRLTSDRVRTELRELRRGQLRFDVLAEELDDEAVDADEDGDTED